MGSEWIEVIWGVRDNNLPEEIPEGYESWQAWLGVFQDRPAAKPYLRLREDGRASKCNFTDEYLECIGFIGHVWELPMEFSTNELATYAEEDKWRWLEFIAYVKQTYEIELPEGEAIIVVQKD